MSIQAQTMVVHPSSRGPIAERLGTPVQERRFTIDAERLAIDPHRSIDWKRKGYGFKDKSHDQITAEVREKIMHGDHLYVILNDKIGDMVQASTFMRALADLRKSARHSDNPHMSLMIPSKALQDLFAPFAAEHGIKIEPDLVLRLDGDPQVRFLAAKRNQKNVTAIEFENYFGEPSVERDGLTGAVLVRDVFSRFNADYTTLTGGIARYNRYFEDFFGLQRGSLVEPILPELPLSKDSNRRFEHICSQYGIDSKKRQIALLLEATSEGRLYDYYEQVVEFLKREGGDQVEVNLIFDPKRSTSDPKRQEWEAIASKFAGQGVRLMSVPLGDMPSFLANMSAVGGADSGLGHITAAVKGGPNMIPIYLPPDTRREIWETNPVRMYGMNAPLNQDVYPIIDGPRSQDRDAKRINNIPPESFGRRLLYLMRTTAERPSYQGNRADGIKVLYQEILGRSPRNDEKQYYEYVFDGRRSFSEIARDLRQSTEHMHNVINHLYQDVLGRDADPSGLSYYIDELSKGRTVGSIRMFLAVSQEAMNRFTGIAATRGREQAVATMFKAVLGRPMDEAGKKAYVESSLSGQAILTSLLTSNEFRLSFLDTDWNKNAVNLEQMHRDLFRTEISSDDLSQYLTRISAGLTVAHIRKEVLDSGTPLARIKQIAGNVRTTAVKLLYEIVLGREADLGGLNHYANESTESIDNIYMSLLGSQEYLDNFGTDKGEINS